MIKARRGDPAAFVGKQLVVFGGFNDEFNNDMYYCQFLSKPENSKEDTNYTTDTVKCINNPFRSDVHFILNPSKQIGGKIVYCHSFMLSKSLITQNLVYKLMSI